jgi:CRISPR/Cas system-associated protein Cas7 (RAMP superfamily)
VTQDEIHKLIDARINVALDARLGILETSFGQHKEDMMPVVEFFKTINSLNKFFKWGGIGFFAVVGLIYLFIKKL